jgi:hypothetical protein
MHELRIRKLEELRARHEAVDREIEGYLSDKDAQEAVLLAAQSIERKRRAGIPIYDVDADVSEAAAEEIRIRRSIGISVDERRQAEDQRLRDLFGGD